MKSNKEIIEKYKHRLQECANNSDEEIAHRDADGILVEILDELGFQELTEIYDKVGKWYG